MRRTPAAEIVERAAEIEHAFTCCYCTVAKRDKSHGLAQVVLAVELFEDLGFTHEQIRGAVESVLNASAPARDPRADTTGT